MIIIRGEGGTFCAGGDIKDMAALRVESTNIGSLQPYTDFNRRFGAMLEQVEAAPQTVVVSFRRCGVRWRFWAGLCF
ncbi:hypothetical protein ABVN80_13385 [Acinetobacter baumannii]